MVVLAKNSTKTNRAGIDNDGGFFVGVEVRENGVAGEKTLQLIKSVLMLGCPCPRLIRFGKRTEGFGDSGIIGDKSGTVVGHTEETANFMSGGRGAGIVDGRDFLGVWGETIRENTYPKNSMLDLLNSHFLPFNVRFLERKRSKTAWSALSCAAWSVPKMMISSLTLRAPSIPLRTCWMAS